MSEMPTMPENPTMTLAKEFAEMLATGDFNGAMAKFYADDAVHIEAMEDPSGQFPRVTEGKEAITKSSEWWEANNIVHGYEQDGPYPHEDKFIIIMKLDITPKAGPMTDQRMDMHEAAHYHVKDGKINKVEFYYSM